MMQRICSFKMGMVSVWLTLFMLVVAAMCGDPCLGADLSAEEQKLLVGMTPEAAQAAVKIVSKLPDWRQRVQQLRVPSGQSDVDVLNQAADSADDVVALISEIAEALKPLMDSSPQLAAALKPIQEAKSRLDSAKTQASSLQQQITEFDDIDPADSREMAEQFLVANTALQAIDTLEKDVFELVERLKNPAEYLKSFVDGKFREFCETPLPLDSEDFVARIVRPKQGVPIFSEDANIGLEVEYLPGNLSVEATGLYFAYQPGKLPRPVLDKIRMETDLKKTVLDNLTSLGEEFLKDVDLPIKVTLKNKPDFQSGIGAARGAIPFDVEVGLLKDGVVKVTAKDLALYPGNRVDGKNIELKTVVPLSAPVLIPGTVFGLWTIEAGLRPQGKQIMMGTKIATMATLEPIHLKVEARTQIPVKRLDFKGQMMVINQPMMTTTGAVDFSKGTVEGTFEGSAMPGMESLAALKGKFFLRKEEMITDGDFELCGKRFADMHCRIDFRDASADLSANTGFELFGADFSTSLTGRIEPGFKAWNLNTISSLTVDGVGVVVEVDVDSRESDPVLITLNCCELQQSFRLPSLDKCTPGWLKDKVGDALAKAYHRLLKSLAKGEGDFRIWAAKLDENMRVWLDKNLGVDLATGYPEIDNLGKEVSEQAKRLGYLSSSGVKGAAGDLSEGLKNLADGGSGAVGGVLERVSGGTVPW